MKPPATLFALTCTLLASACGERENPAEDRLENAAEASAATSGAAEVALGLTERQLLDADLVDAAGVELGEVSSVLRDAGGQVDRLLVELEDSNPDKYVHVPVAGLKPIAAGNDWNLATTRTKQELTALPAVPLTVASPGTAPTTGGTLPTAAAT